MHATDELDRIVPALCFRTKLLIDRAAHPDFPGAVPINGIRRSGVNRENKEPNHSSSISIRLLGNWSLILRSLICVICSIRSAIGCISSIVDRSGTCRIRCFVRRLRRFLSVLICFFQLRFCFFQLRFQLTVFSFEFINALPEFLFRRSRFTTGNQRKSKAKDRVTAGHYAASLKMGAIARLNFVPEVAKKPAHSDLSEHSSHAGRYCCFQSLIERRAYARSFSGSTQSWVL